MVARDDVLDEALGGDLRPGTDVGVVVGIADDAGHGAAQQWFFAHVVRVEQLAVAQGVGQDEVLEVGVLRELRVGAAEPDELLDQFRRVLRRRRQRAGQRTVARSGGEEVRYGDAGRFQGPCRLECDGGAHAVAE
ncbi:hypothetical protein WKI68_05875 [Streptomyces sp. MS1.HAVA.3]|uniref:Uncharacterized protein n=1 Tax=Streptomyces caledonius TaxID=3134107 RepID=A0ABU8TZS6_9ACTN